MEIINNTFLAKMQIQTYLRDFKFCFSCKNIFLWKHKIPRSNTYPQFLLSNFPLTSPNWPLPKSCFLYFLKTQQILLVMPVCVWMWRHPVEHVKLISSCTLKDNDSSSPSSCKPSIELQQGVEPRKYLYHLYGNF